jgi:hypothetical protein
MRSSHRKILSAIAIISVICGLDVAVFLMSTAPAVVWLMIISGAALAYVTLRELMSVTDAAGAPTATTAPVPAVVPASATVPEPKTHPTK